MDTDLCHYLYVVEFSDRVVKVGRTCRLNARFKEHEREARKIHPDMKIRSRWVSFGFPDAAAGRAERALIALCKAKWPVAQGQEFFDAPFDDVVDLGFELDEAYRPTRLALQGRPQDPPARTAA